PTLSLDQIKRLVRNQSRIIPEAFDMCPNTCIAYTGSRCDLRECPKCHLPRYRQKTMRSGRTKDARWATPQGSSALKHRARRTKALLTKCPLPGMVPDQFDDIYCGSDYLKLVHEKEILPSDTLLAFLLDSAQVFNNKKPSDAIFIIMINYNLPPEIRYKQQYVIP
ncbi:hypothetical protein BT69DRAFT_1190757, partial [Atractiella rhizophila]